MTIADDYDTAIALRNRAWCRWQDALEMWESAGSGPGEALAAVNARQQDYEWAKRALVKAHVWFREEGRRLTTAA